MLAAQVMTPDVLSISSDATVFEAAELLVGSGVSAMPVVDGTGRMIGIAGPGSRGSSGTKWGRPRSTWRCMRGASPM